MNYQDQKHRTSSRAATLDRLLLEGAKHHQAGRLAEAERIYLDILHIHPHSRDANHNIAALYMQTGRGLDKALPHFRAAWEADPSHAQHTLSYLRALVMGNLGDQATRVYLDGKERGLTLPPPAELGLRLKPTRDNVRSNPPSLPTVPGGAPGKDEWRQIGQSFRAGSYERMAVQARSVTERFPDHGPGWMALAEALRLQGCLSESLPPLKNAARLLPDDGQVHQGLGDTLLKLGLLADAEAAFRRAVALLPSSISARCSLARVLLGSNRIEEAECEFRRALEVQADSVEAHCGLGFVHAAQERHDEARASFETALALKPDSQAAYRGLYELLVHNALFLAAEALCRRTIVEAPSLSADALRNLGFLLTQRGCLDEAQESYRKAVELDPGDLVSRSCSLFIGNYLTEEPSQRLFEEAKTLGRISSQAAIRKFTSWPCSAHPSRLRVGLVSGDLREHPVGYFLKAALQGYRSSSIDWIAYTTSTATDSMTDELKEHFLEWNSLVGLSDELAAQRVHQDGNHILIDLAGHTMHSRLPMFSWRPAPVQVSWLGYFATTGIEQIDYLLADEISLPKPLQASFTEEIVYLPDTRLCFSPPDMDAELRPPPAMAKGHITFGCFQALPKLSDKVLVAWSRILNSCPDARLRLQNHSLSQPETVVQLKRRLLSVGIDAARVDCFGATPRRDYLAAYADVDILLDSFPYPGGTTTCEALWMGVPTVTLAGHTFIARQGASLLAAAGLADWVADSVNSYVALAVEKATDLPSLARCRAELRTRVSKSPLFDAPRFAGNLEKALWGMWSARRGDA